MFSLSYSKSKPLIGIDINFHEVRLLQLNPSFQSINIEKIATQEIPPHTLVEGKIKDKPALTQALLNLFHQVKPKTRDAVIALPSQSVISKQIKLDTSLSEEECEIEILTQINDYFPGIEEELCFDFVPQSADAEYQTILLIAARQKQLLDYLDVVNQAGFHISAVDIDVFALARAVKWSLPEIFQSDKAIAILNIDRDIAQFIVIQSQNLIFQKNFSVLDLNEQLNQTIQLYSSMHSNIPFHSLIFVGENKQFIKTEWENISIIRTDPFSKIANGMEYKNFIPRMLVAFGLAIRN